MVEHALFTVTEIPAEITIGYVYINACILIYYFILFIYITHILENILSSLSY